MLEARALAIAVVVLAVSGLVLYGTGTEMSNRVDDALRRAEVASEAGVASTGLDEASSLQLRAELANIESALDRATLLRSSGLLLFVVALMAGTHATYAALAKRVIANMRETTNDP